MNEHTPDDDLQALRAADPAAGDDAPPALRERIADLASDEPAVPVPLTPRRRWALPVAAAAAVVAAIGGGYVWGTGGIDLTPPPTPLAVATGTPDDPAAAIDLGGSGGGASGDGTSDLPSLMSADLSTAADARATTVSPWHYANNRRFDVPVFDSGPEKATVYALDGRAQYSADDATRIAAALGVEGSATQDADNPYGWHVGSWMEWTQPAVSLTPTGDGAVTYRSGIRPPWMACTDEIAPRYDLGADAPEERFAAYSAEVAQCVANTPMPAESQARDALSLFLSAIGVEESTTAITVLPNEEGRTISATAARIVGDNTTVVTSFVEVSAAGFLSANGASAPVVSLGDYAIVTPAEAAARLNDPVYAPAWAASTASDVSYESMGEPRTEPPAVPAQGAKVPWGITEFEISSARLGLALMTSPGDERFLAPAYEFTDTEGNVWSVLALAESEIDPTGGGAQGGGWGRGPWG